MNDMLKARRETERRDAEAVARARHRQRAAEVAAGMLAVATVALLGWCAVSDAPHQRPGAAQCRQTWEAAR